MEKTSFKRRDLSLGSLDINHKEQRNRCWGRMSRTFKGVRIEKCDLEREELRYRKCHGQRILFRTLNKQVFFLFFFFFLKHRSTSNFHFPIILYSNHRKNEIQPGFSRWVQTRSYARDNVCYCYCPHPSPGWCPDTVAINPCRCSFFSAGVGWGGVCGGELRGEEGWCAVSQGPWCDQSIQLWSLVVGLNVQRMQTCSVTCPWMFVCILLFFVLFINMHGEMKERLKKKDDDDDDTTMEKWMTTSDPFGLGGDGLVFLLFFLVGKWRLKSSRCPRIGRQLKMSDDIFLCSISPRRSVH